MSDTPFVVARAQVLAVARLSPSFARVTFGGPDLEGFGNPQRILDQRIKLIFPGEQGLPALVGSEDWYGEWLALPEAARGTMRTYSIRDLTVAEDGTTQVVVDFVLHLAPGASGPASRWAAQASAGDSLLLIGPRRGRLDGGGIEYLPEAARSVVLAGDETALPAIARILEESAGDDREITAYVEVPHRDDRVELDLPGLRWLVRGGAPSGSLVVPAVLKHLGAGDLVAGEPAGMDLSADTVPWETPIYSNLEDAAPKEPASSGDHYFWIAGESHLVTSLRRHLVRDLGMNRNQVAFMGYWRRGVAMRG